MPVAGVIYYGYSTSNKAKITVLANDDYLYHDLYIDGKRIRQTEYTINATTISVPAALVKKNSCIDIDYIDADPQQIKQTFIVFRMYTNTMLTINHC